MVALVCLVLPLVMVVSTINRHPKFSPIDEAAHWDYVERVYVHGIPTFGDRLMKSTLRELSCRQTRLEGLVVPECNTRRLEFEYFPGGAFQYEAQQPPLYYLVTAPPARIVEAITGIGAVGATRLIGALWLIAGLVLLWRVGLMLGVPRTPALATLLVVSTAPTVVYYSSIVSNDSTGILCGSVAAWVGAAAFTRGKSYARAGFAVGIALALMKTSCALPAGVVGLTLLLPSARTWWLKRRGQTDTPTARHLATTGTALIAGAFFGTLAWVAYYRAMATIEPKKLPTFDVLRIDNMTPSVILHQARSFLGIFTESYTPFAVWNGDVYTLLGFFTALAMVAGLVGGAYATIRKWWTVAGPIVLVALYVGGVVIGLGIWRAYDINPGVSARYALPMLPLAALVVPAGLQRRGGQLIYSSGCLVIATLFAWMIARVPLG